MAVSAEVISKWENVLISRTAFWGTYVSLKSAAKKRPLDSIEKEQLRVVENALRQPFIDATACLLLSITYGIKLSDM